MKKHRELKNIDSRSQKYILVGYSNNGYRLHDKKVEK